MSLAENTKGLLATDSGGIAGERTAVEYHFLSWRELYDKTIVTADRYSSGSAKWVVKGGRHFYTVAVVSHPAYALPQQLCLFFDCLTTTKTFGSGSSVGPPLDEVAFEFATVLSVLAREPLVPLGPRRISDCPVAFESHYVPPPRAETAPQRPAAGINSYELLAIIKGMANAEDATVNAALAASKQYHAALSLVPFDPSGAYVSLVSAIECLAGHHLKNKKFDFDGVPKFDRLRPLLEQVVVSPNGGAIADGLKKELLRAEHFLIQKFILFITDHLSSEFWEIPDESNRHKEALPVIKREHLSWCLRQIYTARSRYTHAGEPFPAHIELGIRRRVPSHVMMAGLDLVGKEKHFPVFAWFERLVHLVISEYLRRSFAPELVQARKSDLVEKQRLMDVIRGLSPNVRQCLKVLTEWTAQFLDLAVINPLAPNKSWADSPETIDILQQTGVIDRDGVGFDGHAWLKSREVGEAVGEFFFGTEGNLFRGNEILLPKDWDSLVTSFDDSAPDN